MNDNSDNRVISDNRGIRVYVMNDNSDNRVISDNRGIRV